MAYMSKDLSVLAYANGFTLWHYTTSDSEEMVLRNGYFNAAADMLRKGDTMIVNVDTCGDIGAIDIIVKDTANQTVAVKKK